MSGTDADLARQVSALIEALEELQRELEPGDRGRLRPPSPRELLRLTSEVTIPAAILVLETNVRVLRLLQRTIRMAQDEDSRETPRHGLQERAASLSRETLDRLEGTLAELQSATDERGDAEVDRLVERARRLRTEIDEALAAEAGTGAEFPEVGDETREPVDIDVEAELDAIRRQVDDEGGTDDDE